MPRLSTSFVKQWLLPCRTRSALQNGTFRKEIKDTGKNTGEDLLSEGDIRVTCVQSRLKKGSDDMWGTRSGYSGKSVALTICRVYIVTTDRSHPSKSEIMFYFFTKELDLKRVLFPETEVWPVFEWNGISSASCSIPDLHHTLHVLSV
jgi:hypothetical protein